MTKNFNDKDFEQALAEQPAHHTEQHLEMVAEQPAHQEPVGSLSVRYHRGCKSMTNTDFDYNGDLPEGDYELYTSPPYEATPLAQRQARSADTWVGLEEGEMLDALTLAEKETVMLPLMLGIFARAIEAKLKAKNSP